MRKGRAKGPKISHWEVFINDDGLNGWLEFMVLKNFNDSCVRWLLSIKWWLGSSSFMTLAVSVFWAAGKCLESLEWANILYIGSSCIGGHIVKFSAYLGFV